MSAFRSHLWHSPRFLPCPLLYVIYASKLFNVIERHLPDALCYADDSHLYLSFRPADGLSSQTDAIQAMERCIEDGTGWLAIVFY